MTAEQGNRTPRQRLSAPFTGFEDRARHQPRTLCRGRVYVGCPGRSSSTWRGGGRRARAADLARGRGRLAAPGAGDGGVSSGRRVEPGWLHPSAIVDVTPEIAI